VRKVLFLFIFIVSGLFASAQQVKQIQLTTSKLFKGFTKEGMVRFISPVFSHQGSTLTADSADYNKAANSFDAFGNVVITQPDGTIIYSDLLNYNGNTRVALLTNNVRMVDKDAVLTTNFLTYNLANRIGTYTGGGQIVNAANTLTSKNGYYFASTRDAYFRYDVVLHTPDVLVKTDTLKYNSGSKIAYFYGPTHIYSKSDSSVLYTENGRYNTLTDQAWFGKKNLYTDRTKSLKGDSLYYDGKSGFGKAINNITFRDTSDHSIILRGDQGIYRKADESAMVTRNAYVILETEQDSSKVDSIYMTADTLLTKTIFLRDLVPARKDELLSDDEIDSADAVADPAAQTGPKAGPVRPAAAPGKTAGTGRADGETVSKKDRPKSSKKKRRKERDRQVEDTVTAVMPDTVLKAPVPDSVSIAGKQDSLLADSASLKAKINTVPLDTTRTRIVMAYNKVKIFKSDLQAKADSAFYSYADSTIRCFIDPIVWTQGSQLSADTLYMQLKNRKLDNMLLQNDGFVVSTELDSSKFNQVKGKVLTGLFQDNKLKDMFVDGNAESVYYTIQDSAYTGMNRSLSSRMRLIFEDGKLKDVMLVRKPEGNYYPINKIQKDVEILEGFIWKPENRPRSKEEIIPSLAPKKKTIPKKAPAKPRKPVASEKKK